MVDKRKRKKSIDDLLAREIKEKEGKEGDFKQRKEWNGNNEMRESH